jgi:hypothetical protein
VYSKKSVVTFNDYRFLYAVISKICLITIDSKICTLKGDDGNLP